MKIRHPLPVLADFFRPIQPASYGVLAMSETHEIIDTGEQQTFYGLVMFAMTSRRASEKIGCLISYGLAHGMHLDYMVAVGPEQHAIKAARRLNKLNYAELILPKHGLLILDNAPTIARYWQQIRSRSGSMMVA